MMVWNVSIYVFILLSSTSLFWSWMIFTAIILIWTMISFILLLLNQNEIEISHFFWKSIMRFSQLLLLMRIWEKDKHIEQKTLYRKRFRRSEKRKLIKSKTQNTKNPMSFWWKDDTSFEEANKLFFNCILI